MVWDCDAFPAVFALGVHLPMNSVSSRVQGLEAHARMALSLPSQSVGKKIIAGDVLMDTLYTLVCAEVYAHCNMLRIVKI